MSSRSKRVSVSGGVSHSSWLKSDVDAFRERRLGLGIGEEPSVGPVGGEPPFADDDEDAWVEVLESSGERLSLARRGSRLAFGMAQTLEILRSVY